MKCTQPSLLFRSATRLPHMSWSRGNDRPPAHCVGISLVNVDGHWGIVRPRVTEDYNKRNGELSRNGWITVSTCQATIQVSRYNDGLNPGLVILPSEESSSVRHNAHLNPIDKSRFNQNKGEITQGLLDKLLLLFVLSSCSGRNGFRPLLGFLVSSF